MYNVIKCQSCGAENMAGSVSCSQCNTRFKYRCPRCQSVVTGGDPSCSRCGQAMNWPPGNTARPPVGVKQADGRKPGGPASWILPLAGLVIILAAAGAGIYWVKTMMDEPKPPALADNVIATGEDNVFTPDTSAPRISNVTLTNVNFNTVRVTWTTDEPSNSQLAWHIKDGVPQSSQLKEAMVTDHLIELTNLKNKSTYYYQARSVDQFGNEAVSGEKTFDIGIQRGALNIEVAWSAIKTIEQQPSVFKTVVNGEIKNTGESTLSIREVEVLVTVSVAGKQGVSVVQASLDPYPLEIYPQASHKFVAELPNRAEPVYKVEARVVQE